MKSLLFLFLFALALPLSAQRNAAKLSDIGGMVVDSASGKPLPLASVSLLLARDSSYVMGTISDVDGMFQLRNVAQDNYRILITFVGYRNASQLINVTSNFQVNNAGIFQLVEQSNQLQEVVVRQESPPVTVKQDTVEFNAGSFRTQPNAAVEELLRKLPGIEVSRDGSIKANGQKVSRVLVDGKPFFGHDPRMATRNLPAAIVNKIQLFDQASDQAQFTGIDDGNQERTINITLRRDKRKGYFGQNSLGLGTARKGESNRYQGQVNLNRFNNGTQLSLIGQANNLNRQNFTIGIGPAQGSGLMGSSEMSGATGSQSPTNVIEVRAIGINYRDKLGRRAEIATSYFLNQAITTTDQQSQRESILPDRSFSTLQQHFSRNQQVAHRLNLRLDLQLDSVTSLRFAPSISWQTTDFVSQLSSSSSLPSSSGNRPVNMGKTATNTNSNGLNAFNNLLLMRKFQREGRTLSANLNTALGDDATTAFNRSVNTFYDSTATDSFSNLLNQQNKQASNNLQNTLTVSYTEPVSFTQKLEFRYAYSRNSQQSDRLISDQSEATGLYDRINTPLSNHAKSVFVYHRAGATFQNQRLRYRWAIGADIQQSQLHFENHSADTSQRRPYIHLLPNALFNYTFSGKRSLRLQYRTRLNAPSLVQLQPVIDNTNPLNVRAGNTQLTPEFYNTFLLGYNVSSEEGLKSFSAFAVLNQSNNRIATSTAVSPSGVQTTQPVNVGDFWSANGSMSIGRTLQPSQIGLTFSTYVGLSRAVSFINNQRNEAKNASLSQGIRLQSNFSDNLEYGFSGNITYQTAAYSLTPTQNTGFWLQYATADVFWKLPLRFTLTSDVTYTATTGRAAGYNQQFTLWNMALARQFFKGDQGELRVQVFDLLNQNQSLIRNTTDSYIEDIQSRILRRYLLVSFVYHLRKFGM
ncbi:MAG TPA: TonB-dependent receptor [Runella sp.]|nr:TonB-dependent receptor [Runella sp.]HAO47905.1 TonB-dependent receptor [Runella sp.]